MIFPIAAQFKVEVFHFEMKMQFFQWEINWKYVNDLNLNIKQDKHQITTKHGHKVVRRLYDSHVGSLSAFLIWNCFITNL